MLFKLTLTIFLIQFFTALAFSQTKPVAIRWQKDYNAALKAAQKSGKPLLIDFKAKWCAPCDVMEKVVWSRPDIIALTEEFVCVSVDFDRDLATVSHFGVSSVPHVVFTDPWGNMLAFDHGFVRGTTENALRLAMKTVHKDFSEINEPQQKLQTDENNADASIKIAEFYRKINALFLSNTYLKRALKTDRLKADAELREKIQIAIGENYLKMRDYNEAERIFDESLREFPKGSNNETAFSGLVKINILRRRFTEAEIVFARMKDKYPDSEITRQTAESLQEAKSLPN